MTLCAVWKDFSGIQMASDSRLNVENLEPIDMALKVRSLLMTVSGPIPQGGKNSSIIVRQSLGLCLAGSLTTSNILIGSLAEILCSLQYATFGEPPSLEQICKLICTFFKTVSRTVCNSIFQSGISLFAVSGYCPVQRQQRAFLFSVEIPEKDGTTTFTFNEILLTIDCEFFGAGKDAALKYQIANPSKSPLRILKDIILNGSVKSVGGHIQYGRVIDHDFYVFCVRDYKIDPVEKKFHSGVFLGGLEVYDTVWATEGFHARKTAIDPFNDDIQELIANGYMSTRSLIG